MSGSPETLGLWHLAGRLGPLLSLVWVVSCAGDALCGPTAATCLDQGETSAVQTAHIASPNLDLSVGEIAWRVRQGDSPVAQAIQVINSGAGDLSGLTTSIDYAAEPQGWLTAGLSGSTAPATLSLRADPSLLPLGTHVAEVLVASPSAPNSPEDVRVVLEVVAGPAMPVISLRRPADQRVLQGDQPPATSFWVVNSGGAATTVFFDHPSGDLLVIPSPFGATIQPGDSARFDVQATVAETVAPGTTLTADWLYLWQVPGNIDGGSTGMRIHVDPHVVGGTVNGSGGSFFVWEGRDPNGSCCLDITMTGPVGWNGGVPYPVVQRHPTGIAPSFGLGWSEAVTVDGDYRAAHTQSANPWLWTMDAGQILDRPVITKAEATPPNGFVVSWDAPAASRSSLVSIYSESGEILHEEFVPSGVTTLSIPETANLNNTYRVEVAVFTEDLTVGPLPTVQVNMATAAKTIVAQGRGVMELRPSTLDFSTVEGVHPPSQTLWAFNTGTAVLVGHTYQHSNNFHSVSPGSFVIVPGDSLQFTVSVFAIRPPGNWNDQTGFLPEIYPDAPEWDGATLTINLRIDPG